MPSRREFAAGILALGAASPASQLLASRTAPPAADQLRAGDFLWPKPPGSWVPYGPMGLNYAATPAGQLRLADQQIWEMQRERYLARVDPASSPDPRASLLAEMEYPEFANSYFMAGGGDTPGMGGFYVGHVAIVELDPDAGPMVIEATPPDVRRVPYSVWKEEHRQDDVFHGRVKDIAADAGAAIATSARGQVGKPYDFINFNLLDERGYYCSKLAWRAVWLATGIALDGNRDHRRLAWFSPKQMFYCDTIQHLNSSGDGRLYSIR